MRKRSEANAVAAAHPGPGSTPSGSTSPAGPSQAQGGPPEAGGGRRRKPRGADAAADVFAGRASSLPAFPKPPPIRDGFAAIVRAIYDEDLDVMAEYRAIEAALHVANPLAPGSIRSQVVKAEEMARRAYRLYLIARREYEWFIRQSDVAYGAIRDSARMNLERQKAVGARNKMITDGDVAAEAAQSYPDDWAEVCELRERVRGMKDMVEKLADLAERKCFSLSRLLEPGTGRV